MKLADIHISSNTMNASGKDKNHPMTSMFTKSVSQEINFDSARYTKEQLAAPTLVDHQRPNDLYKSNKDSI